MEEDVGAFVSDNGEGDKVVVELPREKMFQGRYAKITPDDARVLAAKLLRAAKLAERNEQDEEINF